MSLTSSRSELSKLQTNKTKRLYRLPARFYGYQLFILIVLAVVFTWLSRNEALDRWITGFWYDAATQSFPLQKDHLLDLLNHRLAKYIAIALGAVALFYGAYKRNARLVTAALLMGLGALVVGVLKSMSHHSCPWDLVEYGGKAMSYPCSAPSRRTAARALLPRRPFFQRLYGDGTVFCLLARAAASGLELCRSRHFAGSGDGLRSGHARGAFFLSQPVGRVVGLVFPGGSLRAGFHPVC